ncbi:MAG TPA: MBL fold metallo-hydrolase [Longimicrobiales bacterium]|nr:MBL fold metallo-hydrolase [Longimicrobiales bacterium]
MNAPSVRTLRPGLHLLEAEVEDFDVRAAVLVGTERAVVWDTLAHPAQMEGVRRIVAAAGGVAGRSAAVGRSAEASLPLTVVYSHADWDHAWGTCALGDVEDVVAHAWSERRFRSDVPEELRRRQAEEPGLWDAVRLVPPTVLFERTHTLDLGGATLELHALPGHTPDCSVCFVPEWGVLLAGDTVETPLPVVNEARAVAEWAQALERWRDDARVATVVPAHGPVGGRELVEHTLRYLRGLAAGGDLADLSALSPFYRETHRRNQELAGPGSGRSAGPRAGDAPANDGS